MRLKAGHMPNTDGSCRITLATQSAPPFGGSRLAISESVKLSLLKGPRSHARAAAFQSLARNADYAARLLILKSLLAPGGLR